MDPLQRGSSHPLTLSSPELASEPASAPPRAAFERWMARTAERTERGAALEQLLSTALAEGGPGSRVVLEAKAVAGKALKLGAAGKVEIERGEHGYRVLVLGGVAVKGGTHGHAWKAELEQGLTTGRAWHFETREGAAWASSVLLQGLASGTPAALLLPADPGLEARIESLDHRPSAVVLEWDSGAKVKASTQLGGAAAEAALTGAGKVELDRETGELVLEQELKLGCAAGVRGFKLGEGVEAGARLDIGNVKVSAAWVQRWHLSDAQRAQAGRGDFVELVRGLSPATAHCEVKVTLSGQVAGRAFEATAVETARSAEEAVHVVAPESLSTLPVRLAEVTPPHGVGLGVELGPVELEVEAKVEPKRQHPGEARPLGEWLARMEEGVRGLDSARLRQSLAALAQRE